MRVFVIAQKDFYQFLKKWQTFVFMLIMPLVFIVMFGKAYSGGGESALPLLLVSNQDQGVASAMLLNQLEDSERITIKLVDADQETLQKAVSEDNAAAGLRIQPGLDENLLNEKGYDTLVWINEKASMQAIRARSELDRILKRVNATAIVSRQGLTSLDLGTFQETFTLQAGNWTGEATKLEVQQTTEPINPYRRPAPGMMLQFAVAGLTGVATILVLEKSGLTEARLRMSGVPAWQVMLGHYLAISYLLGLQFFLLLIFGQVALGLDYLTAWPATLLISLATIFCIAALGLLIGVISRTEEETVVYAMLAMFILSGLGGLWMPLEITGAVFQTIGHFTPLAWAMDGYQMILNNGASVAAVGKSLWVLAGYTLGLLMISILVYQRQKSRTQ